MYLDPTLPLTNTKQEKFCVALAAGNSKAESYKIAGYGGKRPTTQACTLYNREGIKPRVKALQDLHVERSLQVTSINREELLHKQLHIYDLAIKGAPILSKDGSIAKDKNGDDLMRPDLANALRSLEASARLYGLNTDVVKTEDFSDELKNMSDEEKEEFKKTLINQIDPNLSKRMKAEAEPEETSDLPEGEILQ